MKKFLFLVNPASGGKLGTEVYEGLLELKRAGRLDGEIRWIQFGAEVLSDLNSFDALVVAGGDGSVSSLLPCLLNKSTPVGIIPLGTANDLARELQLSRIKPAHLEARLKQYSSLFSQPVDIWALNSGGIPAAPVYFCNYASFGYEAAALHQFSEWRKCPGKQRFTSPWLNRWQYARAAFSQLGSAKLEGVSLLDTGGGRSYNAEPVLSIFFANIRKVMGLGVSNLSGSIHDRRIEALKLSSSLDYLRMLGGFRLGFGLPQVLGSSESWEIDGLQPGTALQVDGEPHTLGSDSKCRLEYSGSVRFLVGQGAGE
jgi:hypothetical protein